MSFTDLKIEEYTGFSVVVYGETRKYKEDLKKLGGKYNGRLANGPGWIFPKTSQREIEKFINGGKRLVTTEEAHAGEERSKQRAKEWEQENKNEKKVVNRYVRPDNSELSHTAINTTTPTLTEYGSLIISIKLMSSKIERIDNALTILLSEEQKEQLKDMMKSMETLKKNVKKNVIKKVVKKKELVVQVDSDESHDSDESEEEEVAPTRRLMR
jgi:hypothetical protein